MSDWVSARDAADYLNVSPRTTRRWAREIVEGDQPQPRGANSRLTRARRTAAGRYFLDEGELERVQGESQDPFQ